MAKRDESQYPDRKQAEQDEKDGFIDYGPQPKEDKKPK
jgi:hypothetical protein